MSEPAILIIGGLHRWTFEFLNANGEPTDPDTVTVRRRKPDDVTAVFVYGTDPDVEREDVGRYRYSWVVDGPSGRGDIRGEGTGAVQQPHEEAFLVKRTAF